MRAWESKQLSFGIDWEMGGGQRELYRENEILICSEITVGFRWGRGHPQWMSTTDRHKKLLTFSEDSMQTEIYNEINATAESQPLESFRYYIDMLWSCWHVGLDLDHKCWLAGTGWDIRMDSQNTHSKIKVQSLKKLTGSHLVEG